ncbi:hypothetical protein C0J52_25809 [Blattella germanica]|nr:hypothetical protein C0J52_25809 [Blattella germanica]
MNILPKLALSTIVISNTQLLNDPCNLLKILFLLLTYYHSYSERRNIKSYTIILADWHLGITSKRSNSRKESLFQTKLCIVKKPRNGK